MRKDPYAKERAELKQKKQGLNDPMSKFYSLLLKNAKGEKGDTPIKGKDYFTPTERKEMIADILEKIPVPKDADPVDYDIVLSYITQEVEIQVTKEVAKIPKPKDGEKGKDAVVDIPAIVQALLKTMPKLESKEVDYLGVKEYIDKEVKKIKSQRPQVIKSFTGGGATSLSQLVDADLSGLSKNANGQYILGSGGGGSSTFTDLTDTPANYTGQAGKFIKVNAGETALGFVTPVGLGDVVGPASAVDSNFVSFDNITGKLIKDSGKKASDFATPTDIANFETTTQLNTRDTNNRARANHTGTQAIATITNLQTTLDSKVAGAGTVTVGRLARFTGTNGVTIGQTTGLYEDGSGNVGIGTTNPTSAFHLSGMSRQNRAYVEQFEFDTNNVYQIDFAVTKSVNNYASVEVEVEGTGMTPNGVSAWHALWHGVAYVWNTTKNFQTIKAESADNHIFVEYIASSGTAGTIRVHIRPAQASSDTLRNNIKVSILTNNRVTTVDPGTLTDTGGTSALSVNPLGITANEVSFVYGGNVGIGTTTPSGAKLHVYNNSGNTNIKIDTPAGNYRQLQFLSDNSVRWSLFTDPTAESGANAGSDFKLNRYNDSGVYLGTAFGITRSTGNVGIGTTAPTALLHLKAGTASTAPFKFTAGTALTIPEAGVFEFSNSETGLTFTAVSTRRAVVLDTATQTLTNKRINPRQDSTTSSATITPDKANYDEHYRTAQAVAITISNATTPSVGDKMTIYLTDNATARAISFGTDYVALDGLALPTTTTASKTMEIIIKYVTTTKALVSYVEEA